MMTKHEAVRADDMYIGTGKGEVRIVNEAHKLADEALKNAPIAHKSEDELRIDELESKVSTLTKTLTQTIGSLQSQINMKVDKENVIASINSSDEEISIQGSKITIDNETIKTNVTP